MLIFDTCLVTTRPQDQKLPVAQRMARARAAKADKKLNQAVNQSKANDQMQLVAIECDTPSNHLLENLGGKAVHRGQRGAPFYVNKNGNKTYLSSNQ